MTEESMALIELAEACRGRFLHKLGPFTLQRLRGCAAMRVPTATEGESRMAELLDHYRCRLSAIGVPALG